MNKQTATILAGTLLGIYAIPPGTAHAQISAVTGRPFTANIEWCQLNFPPNSLFPTPQPFASYNGIEGDIGPKGEMDQIVEQCCAPPGSSGIFDGNFEPGDIVVTAGSTAGIALSFEKPVTTVGTQLASNTYGSFTAKIQAFNKRRLLGTFTEIGTTTTSADNSAIFLGVTDPKAEITNVVYTVVDSGGNPEARFAINHVSVSQ